MKSRQTQGRCGGASCLQHIGLHGKRENASVSTVTSSPQQPRTDRRSLDVSRNAASTPVTERMTLDLGWRRVAFYALSHGKPVSQALIKCELQFRFDIFRSSFSRLGDLLATRALC